MRRSSIWKTCAPASALGQALRPARPALRTDRLQAHAPGAAPDDTAVVMFTSGSEGTPKGVVLSHANLQANRFQLSARVDFNPSDQVFNALPVFHSFGLTAGLILPLLSGIKTFLYPSPLHYRIVPELVYGTNSTIMFGTDTFLAGYARSSHPYDFYSVRYVFAGAEKVKPETREAWSTSSACASSKATAPPRPRPCCHQHADAVPRRNRGPLPAGHQTPARAGARHRDRRPLCVSGPNVMKGYLLADEPGRAGPARTAGTTPATSSPRRGRLCHHRGPRQALRQDRRRDGFADRGRGACLGSLARHGHAVVSLPDKRKGEQLILITEAEKPTARPCPHTARPRACPRS